MKKALLFAIVVGVVSLTACKKDRVCTCNWSSTATGSTSSTTVTTYTKAKKHDARLMCMSTTNVNSDGDTITNDCALN